MKSHRTNRLVVMYVLLQFWLIPNSFAEDLQSDPIVLKFAKEEKTSVEEIAKRIKKCADFSSIDLHGDQYFCVNYDFASEDLKLNGSYRSLMKNIKGTPAEAKLVKSQRAWITFRDAVCEYESDGNSGGRDEYSVITSCKTERTKVRQKELEQYLKCNLPGCPGEW